MCSLYPLANVCIQFLLNLPVLGSAASGRARFCTGTSWTGLWRDFGGVADPRH